MNKLNSFFHRQFLLKLFCLCALFLACVRAVHAQVHTDVQAPDTWTSYGNNVYIYDSTVKVGIGTDSPTATLTVYGNAKIHRYLGFEAGSDSSVKGLIWSGNANYLSRIDDYLGQLRILTDDNFYLGQLNSATGAPTGNYALYADIANSRIGIGTTSPSYKLHVVGQSYITGTVGIGTTPDSTIQLKVKGSLHVENSSGTQVFHVSAGKQLVFVGADAYNEYLATQNDDSSAIEENNYSLWVSKGIVSEDFSLADVSDWDDYVFDKRYRLPSLRNVEAYIGANGHLPYIPSAAEVKAHGYSLHKLNRGFLKTMEELTLYSIDQDKRIAAQADTIAGQQRTIDGMEAGLREQQTRLRAQETQMSRMQQQMAQQAEQLKELAARLMPEKTIHHSNR